jgi:hypothetical protein
MGGETSDRLDETGTIEELGSVGDWRLPSWMPRISGVAWLFIALTILNVFGHIAALLPRYGWTFSFLFTDIASSLPILIPAAALWRPGRPRPRLLLFGSIAVGIGAFLGSVVSIPGMGFSPVPGATVWDSPPGGAGVYVTIAVLCTVAGPVLLGRAVRAEREPSSHRAVRWGIATGGITIAYLAIAAAYPVELFHRFVTDPSSEGGIDFFGRSGSIIDVGGLALAAWAYFAWAVLSVDADGAQRRAPWRMARVAVLIQQGAVALMTVVFAIWFLAARLGDSKPFADAVVGVSGVVFFVTPILLIVASTLLIAAFASGLADPLADETRRARIDLEPLPNLG